LFDWIVIGENENRERSLSEKLPPQKVIVRN